MMKDDHSVSMKLAASSYVFAKALRVRPIELVWETSRSTSTRAWALQVVEGGSTINKMDQTTVSIHSYHFSIYPSRGPDGSGHKWGKY